MKTTTANPLTVGLPAVLAGPVKTAARNARKSVNGLVAMAIEDYLDARAAEAAYRKGGKRYSLDQIKHDLVLAG